MNERAYQAAEADRRLAALIQVGTVAEVDYGDPAASPPRPSRCRVQVGEWVSALLPWQTLSAGSVRHWNPPKVGEQAMIIAPSGEVAGGFVMPGFYSTQHSGAPRNEAAVIAWHMPDGCIIAYNHETSALSVTGTNSVTINNADSVSITNGGDVTIDNTGKVTLSSNGEVKITAPTIKLDGDVTITGNLDIPTGDMTAQGKAYIPHIHTLVQPGTGNSGIMQ